LGAASPVFQKDGKRQSHLESLWTTLCTESVHLIWKLRCERVIQKEGKKHSVAEVESRWLQALERRRLMDGMVAKLSKGKSAASPRETKAMW
ncbi:hypothetical protein PYCCODRAFT_1335617, partial [Trametes coccinea BRFM310]